ncbi:MULTISPECIES: DUF4404 family protein [Pseudomonas]|jgi:hypothetical protein|uniref:Uncharacterized protein DUF4404 n=2 Tax=Pseudomonas TaxID=286 RepID=A0A9X8EJJ9_PSEPU|nr:MULTISPECIES: DUF4404 family protein [Pseudomonas]KIU42718.1 chromosome partitioning protein ParA [Pseudomonas putida]KTC22760.1 chromosome partitioning protein ParA [Pseudomonas putida]MBG8559770.1 DUF4404 family protein [Pseudomonas qingdaonensis]MCO7503142.1 DUF4404 family protein [Pseudomonas sp. VE 267-6A]MCO7532420.1 DUF4404 family protein [Pseudomonas sp. 2]
MPARELQAQLDALREQLEQNPPLSEQERVELHELMAQIQAKIELEAVTPDNNLVDGVNLAVERFEVEHPGLTATLRNIVQSLQSMGI